VCQEVHVVVADGVVGHDFEVGTGGLEHVRGHPVVGDADDGVRPAHELNQLIRRHGLDAIVDDHVELLVLP